MIEALVGGAVGSALTIAFDIGIRWHHRSRDAQFLVARVAPVLDDFVECCIAIVGDDGLCEGRRDEHGCLAPQVSHPDSIPYPGDVDWRSIDHKLMLELLALPAAVKHTNSTIAATIEYVAGPPDYDEFFEERQLRYAQLGLRALRAADALRAKYRVPIGDGHDQTYADRLRRAVERVSKVRAECERPNAEALEKVLSMVNAERTRG